MKKYGNAFVAEKADKDKFAVILKNARGDRSQNRIARQAGTDPGSISRFEAGKTFPQPKTMKALSKALNADYEKWLFELGLEAEDIDAEEKIDLDLDKILTEDDLDFLRAQQKIFRPFTLRFALDLLNRRKVDAP